MCKCQGKCLVCKCAKYELQIIPISDSVPWNELIEDMENATQAFKEGKTYYYGNYAEYKLNMKGN